MQYNENKTYVMTVYYYSTLPFPDGGMAAGNRIMHLSKALSSAGVKVNVLSPFSDSGKRDSMKIDGIEYKSLCLVNKGILGFLLNRWSFYVLFPLRFASILCRDENRDRVIYCYGGNLALHIVAFCISRIFHCPLCREGAEFPSSVYKGQKGIRRFLDLLSFKLFDGIVAITHELKTYYEATGRADCRVFHVPMTVDWALFANEVRPSPFDFDYIAYTGSMDRIGGGVDILVKAFALVAKDYDIHLVLIGKGTDAVKKSLLDIVDKDLRSRIHCLFSGCIPRLDMPKYIKNAKILALLPLQTKQQEGCFPTKLGEYLASGVPTVVSNVGIPPKFLTDGENVRFVPAGEPRVTAMVMLEILGNYDVAVKTAKNGQVYARTTFTYENFGTSLAEWFRGLASK